MAGTDPPGHCKCGPEPVYGGVHFERSGPRLTTAAFTKFGSIWLGVVKSGNRESALKTPLKESKVNVLVVE